MKKSSQKLDHDLKVILLGDYGVGKSSIANSFKF